MEEIVYTRKCEFCGMEFKTTDPTQSACNSCMNDLADCITVSEIKKDR